MYEEINIPKSVKQQFDLTGKIALISGGAGFLGIQHAEAIAEMGGTPVLLDVKDEYIHKALEALKAYGYSHGCGYAVDITDEDECKGLVHTLLEKFGKIDILINNAGLTKEGFSRSDLNYFAPFEETSQALWDDTLRVNLTGSMLLTKFVGPVMVGQKKGSIINIASDVGVISPDHRIYQPDEHGYAGVEFNTPASYAVSKAALIHLTRYLATYWAKYNVRVNAFSPAGVYKGHDPAFVKKLSACIPLGRMALPNEYKGAIVFLASDASSFMTGANINMDGGRTAW
jgi:NAD(P)-dependent dehydrogenase (short-subunit alcohol dehydrogenase family)